MRRLHRIVSGLVGLLLCIPTLAFAESVEIVTYYPSPSTTTDDLKVKRASVGPDYKTLNFDDSLAKIEDGTLLIQRSLGIGLSAAAPVPFKTAPDPSGQSPKNGLLGNLDVNDIWLRSTQSWASQAFGADLAPPHPYDVSFEIPAADSNVAYDVYTVLELWKFGVARDKVKIKGFMLLGWGGSALSPPSPLNPQPWPQGLDTPSMTNGVITMGNRANNNKAGSILVIVDW